MELLIVYLVFGGICAAVANSKGRNAVAWFFIGMIFSCFAIVLLLCLPNLKEQKEKERRLEEENRRIREQVRQEQMKLETFRQVTDVRLNYHDKALGVSTAPTAASPLGIGGRSSVESGPPALPTADDPLCLGIDVARGGDDKTILLPLIGSVVDVYPEKNSHDRIPQWRSEPPFHSCQ